MKRLFVCHTVYHIFIACIKQMTEKYKADILIADTVPNNKKIVENIKSIKLFDNVLYLNQCEIVNIKNNYLKKAVKRSFHFAYFVIKLNNGRIYKRLSWLNNYDLICFFNDYTFLGAFCIQNKIKYHLIEDGFDVFKVFNHFERKGKQALLKKILFKLFDIPYCMGIAKECVDVEVNNKEIITPFIQDVIEIPRKQLIGKLTNEDILKLYFVFNMKFINDTDTPKLLLLTQPLIEIGVVKSNVEQLRFYYKIMKEYEENYDIYIKPHPRDYSNYDELHIRKKYIIDKNIPIEMFDLEKSISFEIAVTYSSTSIYSLDFCRKKVILNITK